MTMTLRIYACDEAMRKVPESLVVRLGFGAVTFS
jgi:hypothetical protein